MRSGFICRVVFMAAVLVMIAGAAFCLPYTTGKYKVDVTVRNSAMNLIPGVRVGLYQWDSRRLLVEVSSHGYQYNKKVIDIRENQTFYKCDLVLADLERSIHVVDHTDRPIASAYIRKEQYGYPGDHYGITVYIPIAEWPAAGQANVEVFDSFWGVPLKKSCEITTTEEFYCARMTITRKALKWSGADLCVVFRTGVQNSREVLQRHLMRLKKLGAEAEIPNGAEEALAGYIADNYGYAEIESAGVAVPASLKWLLLSKKRFSELHRE